VGVRAGAARESYVQFLNRTLAAAGLDDEPEVIPIDSLTAQKRLVEATLGIALLAESNVADEIRRGSLKQLSLRGLHANIPVALTYRRDGYLSTTAQNFISALTRRIRK
jgi:DNA-binding transcriptional LysR family regulator